MLAPPSPPRQAQGYGGTSFGPSMFDVDHASPFNNETTPYSLPGQGGKRYRSNHAANNDTGLCLISHDYLLFG